VLPTLLDKVDAQSVIYWTVVGQLRPNLHYLDLLWICSGHSSSTNQQQIEIVEFGPKLTMPPSSDSRPPVYHSNHQALSTARFRCAVLPATADTGVVLTACCFHSCITLCFYRAMLCIRGTSHGPVSVCPSQVGVLLKRLNVESHKQHHTIVQGL